MGSWLLGAAVPVPSRAGANTKESPMRRGAPRRMKIVVIFKGVPECK
ncbi:hypothetical protein [Candidatus Hakubella thermalkaliphila]|nr:hypothetical protein [Candidatus Hakubella thermalkaliphila]